MIASLSLILLCQLAGEVLVRGLGLPMPGPVIGLMLMLVLLLARDRFAVLARGPLQGDGVEKPAGACLPICRCCLSRDEVAGVFAGIAMSLNALVTSLLVPLAVTLLVR
jgi:hypothetical protein